MDEAEALADRIAVIKAGEIVAEGTPETLGGRDRAAYEITFTLPAGTRPADVAAALSPTAGGTPLGELRELERGRVEVKSTAVMPALGALSRWAADSGAELSDLLVRRPTLEDVYLGLTEAQA